MDSIHSKLENLFEEAVRSKLSSTLDYLRENGGLTEKGLELVKRVFLDVVEVKSGKRAGKRGKEKRVSAQKTKLKEKFIKMKLDYDNTKSIEELREELKASKKAATAKRAKEKREETQKKKLKEKFIEMNLDYDYRKSVEELREELKKEKKTQKEKQNLKEKYEKLNLDYDNTKSVELLKIELKEGRKAKKAAEKEAKKEAEFVHENELPSVEVVVEAGDWDALLNGIDDEGSSSDDESSDDSSDDDSSDDED